MNRLFLPFLPLFFLAAGCATVNLATMEYNAQEQGRLMDEAAADLHNQRFADAEKKYTEALDLAEASLPRFEDLSMERLADVLLAGHTTRMYGHALRGEARLAQGKFDQALEDMNAVVSLSDKPGYYCSKEDGKKADQKYVAVCDEALLEARFYRGRIFFATNDFARAVTDLGWVIERNRKFVAEALYFRGVASIYLKKTVDAIDDLNQIVAQYPGMANAQGLLCFAQAEAYLDSGKVNYLRAAEKSYKAAVAIDRNNGYAEQCRLKLSGAGTNGK